MTQYPRITKWQVQIEKSWLLLHHEPRPLENPYIPSSEWVKREKLRTYLYREPRSSENPNLPYREPRSSENPNLPSKNGSKWRNRRHILYHEPRLSENPNLTFKKLLHFLGDTNSLDIMPPLWYHICDYFLNIFPVIIKNSHFERIHTEKYWYS